MITSLFIVVLFLLSIFSSAQPWLLPTTLIRPKRYPPVPKSSTTTESKERDLISFDNEPNYLSLLQKTMFLSRGFTALPSDLFSFLGFDDSDIGPTHFPDEAIFECTPS